MSIELISLLGSVVLFIILIGAQTVWSLTQYPLTQLTGNRDDIPTPLPIIVRRFQRTITNSIESLTIFAPLILIANAQDISTSLTQLGSQLYLVSRVAYSILYLTGVPWLRTIAFVASLTGSLMVLAGIVLH